MKELIFILTLFVISVSYVSVSYSFEPPNKGGPTKTIGAGTR
jgi:hypothetical protein